MKFYPIAGLFAVISALHQAEANDVETNDIHSMLRGYNDEPLYENLTFLKCTFSAFSDESKCDDAVSEDGTDCSYCTLEKNGQKAGICVSSEEAQQMEQVNPDIKCSGIIALEKLIHFEPQDIQCTTEAFGNLDKCMNTKSSDDEWCVFCKIPDISEDKGLCMSYSQSRFFDKNYGDSVSCSDHVDDSDKDKNTNIDVNVNIGTNANESSPILDCNLKGKDRQTCLDSSKVNGSECTWCDAEIGGFCFPKNWEETATKFLKCTSSEDGPSRRNERNTADQMISDKNMLSSFNTSCVKNRNDESCSVDSDSESGESCVWCDAGGVFGLCLDPETVHNVENYLNCGNGDSGIKTIMKDNSFSTSSM